MKHAFIAAAALAAPLLAAPAYGAGPTAFDRADVNKDGFVSETEFFRTQPFELHNLFYRADQENDRKLDRREFARLDFMFERRKRFANR